MNNIVNVKKLVAEQLCISTDDIADDADIVELGADSIDVVELLTTFEDEFEVTIPDEKVESLKTIPAIVKAIEEIKK